MMQNKKDAIRTGVILGLIALILVLFAVFVDWRAVWAQLSAADWRYVAVASLALVAGLAAYTSRWRTLLGDRPAWDNTFFASNAGLMAHILLPLRPGFYVRIFSLGRMEAVTFAEATSSIFVERWVEQIMRLAAMGGALTFGVGLAVSPQTVIGAALSLVAAFGGMVWLVRRRVWILARAPQLLARLPRFTEERARKFIGDLLVGFGSITSVRRMVRAFVWSLLTWVFFWGYAYAGLLALDARVNVNAALAVSLGSLALATPSAPTQPGLYHASVVVPLSLVGYDEALLTSYAVLLHALQMVWIVGIGLWGVSKTGVAMGRFAGGSLAVPAVENLEARSNPDPPSS